MNQTRVTDIPISSLCVGDTVIAINNDPGEITDVNIHNSTISVLWRGETEARHYQYSLMVNVRYCGTTEGTC